MNIKHLVKFIRNYSKKNSVLRKFAVWLCDISGGHEASQDMGFGGGAMLDVWCKHCDAMYQIPVLETNISGIFKDLLEEFKEQNA